MSQETNVEGNERQFENARVGYQVAASLEANEVRALWSRFNAMLTANGIIIGVIGWSLNSAITKKIPLLMGIPIVMSLFGLILCASWYLLVVRKQKYCKYLMLSARELEQRWLYEPVETLARGGALTEDRGLKHKGNPVEIKLGDQTRTIWMRRREKLKTQKVSNFIIGLFGFPYFVSLIFSLWTLTCYL